MLAGKDKGKKGKVLKVIVAENKVIVEGLNIVKRHKKSRKEGKKGEVVEIFSAVHASNVALVEGDKAVRVGYKKEDGKKVRISKKTGSKI